LNHEPEEIIDAEHELVIERVAAIDVAKAAGKVCVCAARQDAPPVQPGVGMRDVTVCVIFPARGVRMSANR
jgi:hypothetical protein